MSKFIKEKYAQIDEQLPQLINEGKTTQEIIEILQISKSSIFRRCKKLGLNIPNYHNSLKFDNTVFDKIDSEEKAYWLGFLFADGNVSSTNNTVSISLKGEDINHLEKFKIFLNASNDVKLCTQKINNKEYSICKFFVCNKHFKETLVNLGCFPRKSLILQFPQLNIFEQDDLVYHFIRGYVDGDGCLTFSKSGRLELNILGTKEFLEGIRNIFPNKFASVHKIKRLTTNVYKISNCGNNADEVSYKLYNNATIYLDRKFNRFAVLNRKV